MEKIYVYFPEEIYKKIYNKCSGYSSKDISEVARELLKKHYVFKDEPEVEGKGRQGRGKEIHRYMFRISDELNSKWEKKMVEQRDKNKSMIMIELFKKYFL